MIHFLVLGGLLFGAYTWIHRGDGPGSIGASREIRIGEGEVAWLRETWGRQWQRDPTPEELRGLVTEYVKEELLAREARAMGLDENDTIVRRRLAQKLTFILEDTSALAVPADDDLRRNYAAHPERYRTEPRISFEQIYLSVEQQRDAQADAEALLAKLNRPGFNESPENLGDRSLLDAEFTDSDERSVRAQFGDDFSQAVFALQPGAWQGPIASGFGLHLVRVNSMTPGQLLEFAEVHDKILDDWRADRKRDDTARYFEVLRKRYHVIVDESVKPLLGTLDSLPAVSTGGANETQ
jgi:hypothetical protein